MAIMENHISQLTTHRRVVRVEWTPSTARISLDCGHTANGNASMDHRVGDRWRCLACSKLIEQQQQEGVN